VVEREFYRMDQDLNSTPTGGDPQHHILPVQAPRPPAALMAEASRPTNPGVASPVTPPEAGAAGSPAGTVPSVHDRPTLVPKGSDPEGGA
jgi:hypothetical protein